MRHLFVSGHARIMFPPVPAFVLGQALLRRSLRRAAAAAMLPPLLLCPGLATAQTLNEQELEQGQSAGSTKAAGWDAVLGAGLAVRPEYEGADTHRVRLVPMGVVSYDRGGFFAGPAGIGWSAIRLPGLRIGPVLGYLGGRKQDASPELTGLGDIPPALTAGIFASYRRGQFRVDGSVRQVLTHQADGLYGKLGFDWVRPIPRAGMVFVLGPSIDFANGAYSRTFFGVTTQQSEQTGFPATGLPPYTPGGGIKDIALNASLNYALSRHWLLRGFSGVERLVGPDGDSPIVQNKLQDFIGMGLAYHFGSGPMPMGGAGRMGAATQP